MRGPGKTGRLKGDEMTIVIQWQHLILIVGFIVPIFLFWVPYSKSGSDNYGIGALITGVQTIVVWLVALVIFFGLGYFGAFK